MPAALVPPSDRFRVLLVDDDPVRRAFRAGDAMLLVVATLCAVASAVIAATDDSREVAIHEAFAELLGWADPLWRLCYVAALAFAAVAFLDTLTHGRWLLVRDQVFALALLVLVGLPLGWAITGSWPTPTQGLLAVSNDYPEFRLALATTVLVVVGPEMSRPARFAGMALVGLSLPGSLTLGLVLPSSLLGGISLAVASAATVRLLLGSSAGAPSRLRALRGLTELGIAVSALIPALRQRRGATIFDAADLEGHPLSVIVVGRDAQDTRRAANAWRRLSRKGSGAGPAPGRLLQVEHESLMTLLAQRGSVRVPSVVGLGRVTSGDALLVLDEQVAPPLEDLPGEEVTDDLLQQIWAEVTTLQGLGVAHGQLHAGNVLLGADGPVISDFSEARPGATSQAKDIDIAELLVSTTILVGPDRALAAALGALGQDRLVQTLPYVQRAALTPRTRDRAREHEVDVRDLRKAIAKNAGVDVPQIAALRRVRWRDIGLMALLAFAAYLLLSQLADVGIDTIVDQLSQASWPWVIFALIIAQTTFISQAFSIKGSVLEDLPTLPCVVLESAIKFINLTVPSSAGRIAINIRFLQKLGAPTPQAVAAGAVDGVSETVVQIVLFLLVLPFIDLELDASTEGGIDTARALRIGLAVIVAAALVVFVVLVTPRWRAKVLPMVRVGTANLVGVAKDPRRRLWLFGGNAVTQTLFALTLGASCMAYGTHVSLPELIFVNTAVSVFASILPVPGGIGVAEAGLTAGLVAVGVDPSVAFAAAITHRLCTYYLPPIWGYFSLRWLARHGYV